MYTLCICYFYVAESFNWTAQPTNPTPAIKGQDVSLAWQYSLTADEQLQSQTQFIIKFSKKLNHSSSNYDQIGAKSFFKVAGPGILYLEPQSPRIVINRNDQATLHIKDVRRDDEGTYKIEFTFETDGSVLVEQKVNLTVLGKLSGVISFPDLLWTKPKARSGKVRIFVFLDWLLHLTPVQSPLWKCTRFPRQT